MMQEQEPRGTNVGQGIPKALYPMPLCGKRRRRLTEKGLLSSTHGAGKRHCRLEDEHLSYLDVLPDNTMKTGVRHLLEAMVDRGFEID